MSNNYTNDDVCEENNYCTKEMPVKCGKCKECIKKLFDQKWVSSPALGYNCKIMKNELNDTGHWIEIDKMYRFCPLPKEPTEEMEDVVTWDKIVIDDPYYVYICCTPTNSVPSLYRKVPRRKLDDQKNCLKIKIHYPELVDLQVENSKLKAEIANLKLERDNIIIELNSMGYILNDGKIYQRQPSIKFKATGTISPVDTVILHLNKDEIKDLMLVIERQREHSVYWGRIEQLYAKLEAIE
jgi:hypothetical protein